MVTKADLDQATKLADLHRKYRNPPADRVEQLTKSWKDKNGALKSMTLDYVGHAHLRDILCAEDPRWSWAPMGQEPSGAPVVDRDGQGWARGLWITLTIHGVTKAGYGTVEAGKPEAIKELIGDALRNAAQSFGIAIALWAKLELADLDVAPEPEPDGPAMRPGHALAEAAKRAGFTATTGMTADGREALDRTRRDILELVTGVRSSTEFTTPEQYQRAIGAFNELAEGIVSLRYDSDGKPYFAEATV